MTMNDRDDLDFFELVGEACTGIGLVFGFFVLWALWGLL